MGSGGGKGGGGGGGFKDYYGDIAAVVCMGPVDELRAILHDGKEVWTGSLLRSTSPNPVSISVPGYGLAWFYWGTDTQTLGGGETLLSSKGHPPYRRQAVLVLKQWYFGRERTSAPNIQVVVRRQPVQGVITGAAALLDADGQANPACVIAELLTNPVIGAPYSLDTVSFQTLADELYAQAALTYVSPLLDRPQPARAAIADLLRYFDGWIRPNEQGKLVIGRHLHNEAPPAFDASNTLTAHDLIEEPRWDAGSWADTANEVAVKFRDESAGFKDAGFTVTSGYNRSVTGEPRQVQLEIPFITRRAQAAKFAGEWLKTSSQPTFKGSLVLRESKATNYLPGKIFKLEHDLLGASLICRVTKRSLGAPPSQRVTLDFSAERGISVAPAQSTSGTGGIETIPDAETISLYEFFQPPPALGDGADFKLGCLVARTVANTLGVQLWLKQADSTLFTELGSQYAFGVTGLLTQAYADTLGGGSPPYDDNTETLQCNLNAGTVAADLEKVSVTQTEDDVGDGSMLVFVFQAANPKNFEVMSLRQIRLDAGVYKFKVRRAMFGTTRLSFSTNDKLWVIDRDGLVFYEHEQFETFAKNTSTGSFQHAAFTPYRIGDTSNLTQCPVRSYQFAAGYLPTLSWGSFLKDGVAISNWSSGNSTSSIYQLSLTVGDPNSDLVSCVVTASMSGGITKTLLSKSYDRIASTTETTSFTLPNAGTWTMKAALVDLAGNLKEFTYPNSLVTTNPVTGGTVIDSLLNPSFEIDSDLDLIPDGWTFSPFTSGTGVIDTDAGHGARSFKFTSVGGSGNGGGTLMMTDLVPVSASTTLFVTWFQKSSVAGIRNKVDLFWYKPDKTASATTSTNIYDSTSNPTAWTQQSASAAVPSDAGFVKIKVTGADSSNATAGSARFDGFDFPKRIEMFTESFTSSGSWVCPSGVFYVTPRAQGAGGGGAGTVSGSHGSAGGQTYFISSGTVAGNGGGGGSYAGGGGGGGGGTGSFVIGGGSGGTGANVLGGNAFFGTITNGGYGTGGKAANNASSSSGGAGGYAEGSVAVSPGTSYSYTIGAGGAAGSGGGGGRAGVLVLQYIRFF